MGLVSLFISIVAIGTVVLWKYYPNTVNKIDKLIPDFYGDNIKSLYKKANAAKDKKIKLQYYKELYKELENISTLNKYYNIRQQTAKWLIDHYISINKLKKALDIATKWEKDYPYDFIGKFTYIDVSSKVDDNISTTYIENLYKKHSDIQEVKDKYISYLLEHNNYNQAVKVSQEKDVIMQSYAKFQIFYMDNKKGFSEKQSTKYTKKDYLFKNNKYNLKFNKKTTKFTGLRIDIENIANGTVISNIELIINNNKIEIANMNQINNIKDNTYRVEGNDPYFIFDIPKKLKNYNVEININFTCKIEKPNIVATKILKNGEWQLFVDSGSNFNETESIHFKLNKTNNDFISNNKVDFKNTSAIRVDFPSLKGLKFDDLRIIINKKITYAKNDITSLNNISHTEKYFEVIDSDPFVTINLKEKLNINNVKIEILFAGDENE